MIRLARPWVGAEETEAVAAVLGSGMLVMGAQVAAFEEALASRAQRDHAIACSSGTSALVLALKALDLRGPSGDGDFEVLCPDLSWPSPAHAIVLAGGTPVLVDVDRESWNSGAAAFAAARTERTRAVIAIDQFGMPAAHEEIAAALPGLPMVLDGACSLGSERGGRPSLAAGVIACMSFHPRKVITTGEGGACLTDEAGLAERLRILRNHGQAGRGVFAEAAGNHRMTEMAAAMGLVQLTRLDAIVERRRQLAARYQEAFGERFVLQRSQNHTISARSNWQTFGLVLPPGRTSQRSELVAALREEGVEAGALSYALHQIGSLKDYGDGPYPVAEAIAERGLALPLHPLLEPHEQERVIGAFELCTRRLGIDGDKGGSSS